MFVLGSWSKIKSSFGRKEKTVGRCTKDISTDTEISEGWLLGKNSAMQIDESTDVGEIAQLLPFVRFIHQDKTVEQYFFCKDIPENTGDKKYF